MIIILMLILCGCNIEIPSYKLEHLDGTYITTCEQLYCNDGGCTASKCEDGYNYPIENLRYKTIWENEDDY